MNVRKMTKENALLKRSLQVSRSSRHSTWNGFRNSGDASNNGSDESEAPPTSTDEESQYSSDGQKSAADPVETPFDGVINRLERCTIVSRSVSPTQTEPLAVSPAESASQESMTESQLTNLKGNRMDFILATDRDTMPMQSDSEAIQGMHSGREVVGPWLLRHTEHRGEEEESQAGSGWSQSGKDDEFEGDLREPLDPEGQVEKGAPSQSLWAEVRRATGGDTNHRKLSSAGSCLSSPGGNDTNKIRCPGPPVGNQDGGILALGGSKRGEAKFPASDGARVQAGQIVQRRLLPTALLLVVSFIIVSTLARLVLGGSEQTVAGVLVPGSQEWLHYSFFHVHPPEACEQS